MYLAVMKFKVKAVLLDPFLDLPAGIVQVS